MTGPLPTGGRIDGTVHLFPIRVYYEDTDAGGIVYHAAYLHFAERARTEFLREIAWPHQRLLRETGCIWAVRRLAAEYRQPARLDDALAVATTLRDCRGASVEVLQVISGAAGELARLTVRLAIISATGKPARMAPSLRSALMPFLVSQESSFAPCKSIP